MGAQNREHPNLILQRTANHLHPHTWYESARPRQLDEAITFSRFDLSNDSIGDARRCLTVHDEMAHPRRPSRIPPAFDHPNEQITREQRRRGNDLAAVTTTLLAQQRLIDLVPGQREAMPRQTIMTLLDLGAAPIHSALSTRVLAVAGMAAIAAVLDWRSALELGVPQFMFDVPMRIPVTGRIAEGTL